MSESPAEFKNSSRAAQEVAAMRSEVEAFYSNDWARVRTLIKELEEARWGSEPVADPTPLSDEDAMRLVSGVPDVPTVETQDSADRLSELTEQINEQLRAVNISRS